MYNSRQNSIWKYKICLFTLYYKVLFMEEQNQSSESSGQPLSAGQAGIETLQDIKRIMERSSRFISLSGLSGVAAGICALIGSVIAWQWLGGYYHEYNDRGDFSSPDFQQLKIKLLILALAVLATSWVTAFYFTWRKAKHDKLPVWDHTSRRLTINMLIPLISGGMFILAMLQYDEWRFVSSACLIFYGIALVNASKYTLRDVKWLGVLQIVLGLINTQFIGYGLYFWTAGFGVLHIVYGIIMWWKYERSQ